MARALCLGMLVVALACTGGASAQVCERPYVEFTDGTDFYGNDLGPSVPGTTTDDCIGLCEPNAACYAIVHKTGGACWLKSRHALAMPTRDIAGTDLAVDMSCLRGGMVQGTVNTSENPNTAMTTVPYGDKFLTTVATWDPATPTAVTASSFYSDDQGVLLEGSEALPSPALSTIPGMSVFGQSTAPVNTTVITTSVPDLTVTSFLETDVEGVVTIVSTANPPLPMTSDMPPPPPGPDSVSVGTIGESNGVYTLTNTVPVAGGTQYVTTVTTYDKNTLAEPVTKAFYSSQNGTDLGQPALAVTPVSFDGSLVDPDPFFVQEVTLPTGEMVTINGVQDATMVPVTTTSFAQPMMAPPPPPTTGNITEDATANTYTSTQTVQIADKYVTVVTVFNNETNAVVSESAYYSDQDGNDLGEDPLGIETTTDPAAESPNPFVVQSVLLPSGETINVATSRDTAGRINTQTTVEGTGTDGTGSDESGPGFFQSSPPPPMTGTPAPTSAVTGLYAGFALAGSVLAALMM